MANRTVNKINSTAINTPTMSPPISPPEMVPCKFKFCAEGGGEVVGSWLGIVLAEVVTQSEALGLSREVEQDGSR